MGRWSGRLVVQRTNAYDVNDRFELVVAEGTRPTFMERRPRRRPAALRSTASREAATLAIAAVTFALFLRSRRQLETARRLLTDTPQPPARAPAPR